MADYREEKKGNQDGYSQKSSLHGALFHPAEKGEAN
jgi:hypothetical protein